MYARSDMRVGEVTMSLARGNPHIQRIPTTFDELERAMMINNGPRGDLTDFTSQARAYLDRKGITTKGIGKPNKITTGSTHRYDIGFANPLALVRTESDFSTLISWRLSR